MPLVLRESRCLMVESSFLLSHHQDAIAAAKNYGVPRKGTLLRLEHGNGWFSMGFSLFYNILFTLTRGWFLQWAWLLVLAYIPVRAQDFVLSLDGILLQSCGDLAAIQDGPSQSKSSRFRLQYSAIPEERHSIRNIQLSVTGIESRNRIGGRYAMNTEEEAHRD